MTPTTALYTRSSQAVEHKSVCCPTTQIVIPSQWTANASTNHVWMTIAQIKRDIILAKTVPVNQQAWSAIPIKVIPALSSLAFLIVLV